MFLAYLAAGMAAVAGIGGLSAHAQVDFSRLKARLVYSPGEGKYSYAPSVIQAGDTRYIFTCHNREAYRVRDDIFETVQQNGKTVSDAPVLPHSLSGWDSFHICDPSVLRTRIEHDKTVYRWIMFYLGNDVDRSARNQIGFALAESIDGPWIRYPRPIVTNEHAPGWGVGQASALPLNDDGSRFVLVYTDSGSRTCGLSMVTIDLHDLNKIQTVQPRSAPCLGLPAETARHLNNVDLAWEHDHRRVFAIADMYPYPRNKPSFITDRLMLLSIAPSALTEGDVSQPWTVESLIGKGETGLERNHNAGLVRDENGTLPSLDGISVLLTSSCADTQTTRCDGRAEWTYRLYEMEGARRTK